MGNAFSCCCPANPCERQDEGQRLLCDTVQSPQTSSKNLDGVPGSTDCTTAESSETPSPTDDRATDQLKAGNSLEPAQPEVVSDDANVQVRADALPTQVTPEASADATSVPVTTASAVDRSILPDPEEAATGVVSQVLADATTIVKVSGEEDVPASTAPQTQDVSTGRVETQDAFPEKVESQAVSMEKMEVPVAMTESSSVSVEKLESEEDASAVSNSQADPTLIKAVSAEKLESKCASTVSDSQAALIGIESQADSTPITPQAVPIEKLESQDTAAVIENHAVAPVIESPAAAAVIKNHAVAPVIESPAAATVIDTVTDTKTAATEDLENPTSAIVIDSQPTSTITDSQAVSPEVVPEAPDCSVKVDAQDVLTEINGTTPPKTPEKNEVLAELEQGAVVHLNGSLTEGVSVEEIADVVIVPEEHPSTIEPDIKKASLLIASSSAEEDLTVAAKELSPSSDTHVQFGLSVAQDCEQDVPLHSSEDEQPLSPAVLNADAKLAESIPQHSSDVGPVISMEESCSERGHELNSATTDTSESPVTVSVQDDQDKKRTDKDLSVTEEPCNGEDLDNTLPSVTTEKDVHTEIRDPAADSDAQDVVGLTTLSSLDDLSEEKEAVTSSVSKQEELEMEAETVAAESAVGGLVAGSLDERPGSAGMSLESDGNAVNCEEDLYRGEEEIEEELDKQKSLEMTIPLPEDQCSLEPPMAILMYSEREWKGQTTKSAVIRKGYAALSESFGCLRRVRGDNYCALRASLYQALMGTTLLPDWLQQESFSLMAEELESKHGLINGWVFPDVCKPMNGIENDVDLMKHYLGLLQKWWRAVADSSGLEDRRRVCDELFQGGEDEFGLMEALKLLMLARAVELHTSMQKGDDVPIFCWLLFARDTSSCPRTFLANHLSQVGFSGGLEQVEMFLLGYALRHTIKAYRLYMAETEEFITHYPDDHVQDWPCLCLVTEDDRHYNVAVGESACPQDALSGGPQ
ncbi:uncharacterized protein LOC134065691 [Sardina pilchardus]|uniref:uncharacterized protein LOC134065691 n=1 Tax=Sardina pilchardus TaxID=27697 RepID=UPI002E14128D